MPKEGRRFLVHANATNAVATASKAAEADRQHILRVVVASFSQAPTSAVTLTLREGSTTLATHYIAGVGPYVILLDGHRAATNTAVSAELAAGGAGVTGQVSLLGETL